MNKHYNVVFKHVYDKTGAMIINIDHKPLFKLFMKIGNELN